MGESDALYAWIAKFEVFRVLKLQVILFEIDASIHQLSQVMTIDLHIFTQIVLQVHKLKKTG